MPLLANASATTCSGMMARTRSAKPANLPASPALISPTVPHAIPLAIDYSIQPLISLKCLVPIVSVSIDITHLPPIKIVFPATIPARYARLGRGMIV